MNPFNPMPGDGPTDYLIIGCFWVILISFVSVIVTLATKLILIILQ